MKITVWHIVCLKFSLKIELLQRHVYLMLNISIKSKRTHASISTQRPLLVIYNTIMHSFNT